MEQFLAGLAIGLFIGTSGTVYIAWRYGSAIHAKLDAIIAAVKPKV